MPFNSKVSTSKKGENLSGSSQSSNIQLKVSNHPEAIIQRVRGNPQSLTHSDTIVLQRTIGNQAVCQLMKEIGIVNSKPVQKKENATGLPDSLKAGVESMSGLSMDSVRVHYNSSKPAQVGALAYTQGADIHVAPGQERHLPHEAWHVVQQAEGRVEPTLQMKGVQVNDDVGLEREADVMGGKAINYSSVKQAQESALVHTHGAEFQNRVMQKAPISNPSEEEIDDIETLSNNNKRIVEDGKYELIGFHGTNIRHAKSILQKIVKISGEGAPNTSGVKNLLGEGFYVDLSEGGEHWAVHSAIFAAYGIKENLADEEGLTISQVMKRGIEQERIDTEYNDRIQSNKGNKLAVILNIWWLVPNNYEEGTDFTTSDDQRCYHNPECLVATIDSIESYKVEDKCGWIN